MKRLLILVIIFTALVVVSKPAPVKSIEARVDDLRVALWYKNPPRGMRILNFNPKIHFPPVIAFSYLSFSPIR